MFNSNWPCVFTYPGLHASRPPLFAITVHDKHGHEPPSVIHHHHQGSPCPPCLPFLNFYPPSTLANALQTPSPTFASSSKQCLAPGNTSSQQRPVQRFSQSSTTRSGARTLTSFSPIQTQVFRSMLLSVKFNHPWVLRRRQEAPVLPGRPCGHILKKGESCFRCKCVASFIYLLAIFTRMIPGIVHSTIAASFVQMFPCDKPHRTQCQFLHRPAIWWML